LSTWYERNKEEAKRRSKEIRLSKPDEYKKYSRDSYHRRKNDPLARQKNLWKHAKARAAKKNLPFNIEVEDVLIPDICPIMKEPITPVGSGPFSASLDRIVPELGYIKGNIRVISLLANQMKWNATREQLLTFCKGVLALEKESQAAC
jgi:hypothetical protein